MLSLRFSIRSEGAGKHLSGLSCKQRLTNNLQMFRSKNKDPDIPGLLLGFIWWQIYLFTIS
jgi:hypothetical protein